MSMGMGAGGWIWMAIWILALLVMVGLLVSGDATPARETPLEILRRRYAAGEISEEAYRRAREILGTGEMQR